MLQHINQGEVLNLSEQRLLDHIKVGHLKNNENLSWSDMTYIMELYKELSDEKYDEGYFLDIYEHPEIKISEFSSKEFDENEFDMFYYQIINLRKDKNLVQIIWTTDSDLSEEVDNIHKFEQKLIDKKIRDDEIRKEKTIDIEKKISKIYMMSQYRSGNPNFYNIKKTNFKEEEENQKLSLVEYNFSYYFKYLIKEDINNLKLDSFESLKNLMELYMNLEDIVTNESFQNMLIENYIYSVYCFFTYELINRLKNTDCKNFRIDDSTVFIDQINLNQIKNDLDYIYTSRVTEDYFLNRDFENISKLTLLILNKIRYIIQEKPNEEHYIKSMINDEKYLSEVKKFLNFDSFILSELLNFNDIFKNIEILYVSKLKKNKTIDDYRENDFELIRTYEFNEKSIIVPLICKNWIDYGDCKTVEKGEFCNFGLHPASCKGMGVHQDPSLKKLSCILLTKKYEKKSFNDNKCYCYYDDVISPMIKQLVDRHFNKIYPNESKYLYFRNFINPCPTNTKKPKNGDLYDLDFENIISNNETEDELIDEPNSNNLVKTQIEDFTNTTSCSSKDFTNKDFTTSTTSCSNNNLNKSEDELSNVSNFNNSKATVCTNWIKTGKCRFNEFCKFEHPENQSIDKKNNSKSFSESTRSSSTKQEFNEKKDLCFKDKLLKDLKDDSFKQKEVIEQICDNWKKFGSCRNRSDCVYLHPYVMSYEKHKDDFRKYSNDHGKVNFSKFLTIKNISRQLCPFEKNGCTNRRCNYIHKTDKLN